jgi:hypothetical protein
LQASLQSRQERVGVRLTRDPGAYCRRQVRIAGLAQHLQLVDRVEKPRPGRRYGNLEGRVRHQPRQGWVKVLRLARTGRGDDHVAPSGQIGRGQMLGQALGRARGVQRLQTL